MESLHERKSKKRKYKIFIVDDHPLMREGLIRLLNLQPDLHVCGEAANAHQSLKMIPVLKPDIVILDITLAGSNGMDLIKDMKLRSLKSLILVLSMHDESSRIERGVKGHPSCPERGDLLKRKYGKQNAS
jgi:DNA-binding NarL/FixJ family response regulator